jgi:hypothetical protein
MICEVVFSHGFLWINHWNSFCEVAIVCTGRHFNAPFIALLNTWEHICWGLQHSILQGEEAVEFFLCRNNPFWPVCHFTSSRTQSQEGWLWLAYFTIRGAEDVLNKQYAFELSAMYFIADIDKCARICGHLLSFLFTLFQSLGAFSLPLCFHSLSFQFFSFHFLMLFFPSLKCCSAFTSLN